MCDCLGSGIQWTHAGEVTIRVNRDACSLRSITAMNDLKYEKLSKKIDGEWICCKCTSITLFFIICKFLIIP